MNMSHLLILQKYPRVPGYKKAAALCVFLAGCYADSEDRSHAVDSLSLADMRALLHIYFVIWYLSFEGKLYPVQLPITPMK